MRPFAGRHKLFPRPRPIGWHARNLVRVKSVTHDDGGGVLRFCRLACGQEQDPTDNPNVPHTLVSFSVQVSRGPSTATPSIPLPSSPTPRARGNYCCGCSGAFCAFKESITAWICGKTSATTAGSLSSC